MADQADKGQTRRSLGVVVIGRNEGLRLERCLRSLGQDADLIVYVDSGSNDGSVERARALGADVVELDLSTPFTAARARNAGADRLAQLAPDLQLIQFVDGDCELAAGWLDRARVHLLQCARRAAVAGLLEERRPEASIYNRLCSMEWRTALGEVQSLGGIFMVRHEAFREVGGFDERIIAGEEPELCWRLRRHRWRIHRVGDPMAVHDADIHRLGQWWQRQVRAGHACAENYVLHGLQDFGHYGRAFYSALIYGLAVPVVSMAASAWTAGASLLLLLAYARLYQRGRAWRLGLGDEPEAASTYARYLVLGSFAQATGIVRYAVRRLLGSPRQIIEYKDPAPHAKA